MQLQYVEANRMSTACNLIKIMLLLPLADFKLTFHEIRHMSTEHIHSNYYRVLAFLLPNIATILCQNMAKVIWLLRVFGKSAWEQFRHLP